MGGGGLGIGTIVVLGLVGWALGIDPRLLIGGAEILTGRPAVRAADARAAGGTGQDETGRFVRAVLGSTEVQWKDIFSKDGQTYRAPKLVMFSRRDALGLRRGAERDGAVLLSDRSRGLSRHLVLPRYRAPLPRLQRQGLRVRQAYVIAHEVGHHVQNLLGILPKVQQAQRASGGKVAANRIQVRVELQADCFAGVWAHHAEKRWQLLQPGDIEAALQTATAIGDDMLQKRAQGYVVPDSFTHGSSEQRQRWFTTGFKEGTVEACNTFAAASL